MDTQAYSLGIASTPTGSIAVDAGWQNLSVGSDNINSLPPYPGVTLHPRKNLDITVSYDTLINTSRASAHRAA